MGPRYDSVRNQFIPQGPGGDGSTTYGANGAIAVRDGVHVITKATTGVFTLGAPSAGDDGLRAVIVSRTTPASAGHTVTIAAGLAGRGAGSTVLTFTTKGDAVELLADGGVWIVLGQFGVVVS